MRVFITGATGFVGTHLVRRLVRSGHELICLVRETSDVGELDRLGIAHFTGDVTDRESLLAPMRGCDWVINLANVYSFWEPRTQIYRDVNIEGTRNVMECALEAGVSKVVHVSTMAVYGRPSRLPFTEETPVGPVRFSEYARTKYEGELIAWELHHTKGLPVVVIYPAAVLGPGDAKATGQYMDRLMQRRSPARALQDSVMTFVHVGDVVEAIVGAAEKEGNIGERYLVGDEELTVGEFDSLLGRISGTPLPKPVLPDWLTTAGAALFTGIADVVKRPPAWGMIVDRIRTSRHDISADASKAVRELGIDYTPVSRAIAEFVAERRTRDQFFTWSGPAAEGVDVGPAFVDLPIVYYRDDCFLGFFSARHQPIRALLPSSDLHPVTLPNGRAVVGIAAFNYLETSIGPYGEIAVIVPCTYGRRGPPLLPLLLEGRFAGWGSFVLHLPVTTMLARDAGRVMWGYPKFVADMEFDRDPMRQRVRLSEGDRHILTLTVEQRGIVRRDDRPIITYSVLDGELVKTTVPSRAIYQMGLRRGRGALTLGDHVIAEQLRSLDISPTAFATRNYLTRSGILPAGEPVAPVDRGYDGYGGEDRDHGRISVGYGEGEPTRGSNTGLRV